MIAPSPTTTDSIDLTACLERSVLIAAIPWVKHGITRRVPGLGRADGNVGYTAPRDEADAWAMRKRWSEAIDVDPATLVRVRQHHGNEVHIATRADLDRGAHPDAREAPIADAIITGEIDIAIATLHADCLAIFLVDPLQRVVGAVHAGWRSTVLNVTGETVTSMGNEFGSKPVDLIAYVGPSIGFDHFEVGDEVIAAWQSAFPADQSSFRPSGERWQFDLKQANAMQLREIGVPEAKIEISPICTASDPENWFSHRKQGPLTGRFAAIISIAGSPA